MTAYAARGYSGRRFGKFARFSRGGADSVRPFACKTAEFVIQYTRGIRGITREV